MKKIHVCQHPQCTAQNISARILVITGCPNHHINTHYLCYKHFTYMKVAWYCKTCGEKTTDYMSIFIHTGEVRSSWYGTEYVADYWKETPEWP